MTPLLSCERARADAVIGGDLIRLADMLAADLVYVHAPGQRHNKSQLLTYLQTGPRFLAIDLLNPCVQEMGDCALVTGELHMRLQRQPSDAPVTVRSWVSELWVRDPRSHSGWLLRLLHSTRQADPAAD